jgi:hypothetical protein
MLGLLSLIPGLFTTINSVTAAISNERIKLIQAKTDQEKIAAQERITSLQAKRDVLVAESGRSNFNAFIRGGIGVIVSVILAKLLIWDKVIGSLAGCAGVRGSSIDCLVYRTDVIDGNLWNVIMAVIGFYFLYEAATNTARIIKS